MLRLVGRWCALLLAASLLALPVVASRQRTVDTTTTAAPDAAAPTRPAPTTLPKAAAPTTATTVAPAPTTTATTEPPAPPTTANDGPIPTVTLPPGVPEETRPVDEQGNRIGPPMAGGRVVGRVTAPSGAPVAGVCVAVDAPIPVGGTLQTDADGRWALDLPPGQEQTVTRVLLTDCTGSSPGWMRQLLAPWTQVWTGQTATVDAVLQPAGGLVVTLTDRDGTPLPGACLEVRGVDEGWPTQVAAGADGRAHVDHVLPVRVSLHLYDYCGSTQGFAVGMADVVAGQVTYTTLAVGTAVFA